MRWPFCWRKDYSLVQSTSDNSNPRWLEPRPNVNQNRFLLDFSQIAHTSYSRHQRTKSPQKSWTVYFPATISPFKDILFFPNLPASEKLPEEQIFWGTDPLGAPEIYQLYTAYMFFLALAFKIDEKAFNYEHYLSILVSFLGKTEHFGRKNGAF